MTKPPGVLYRYLLGAMPQLQITMTVRSAATLEEVARLPEIVNAWRRASERMQKLLSDDSGAADHAVVEKVPDEVKSRLQKIEEDPLFQASFSDAPTTISLVEIENMVAPQREVNLDYVATLRERLTTGDIAKLVEFCLETRAEAPPIKALQTAANQMTFTSPSLDLRFLGGFPKQIDEADIRVAHGGGQPVAAVTLFIGFGAAPVNAWLVGRRLVLANGFHRVVALWTEGITRVPMVIRHVANPEIEFPEQYLGLPRSYLLQHKRPVLIRDFFDNELTQEIRLKPRIKTLQVAWGDQQGVVPE